MADKESGDLQPRERILAAVAHGSVIMAGWGIIAPLVIWVIEREKSTFLRFHALQAVAYQVLQIVLLYCVAEPLTLLLMGGAIFLNEQTGLDNPFFVMGANYSFYCLWGLVQLLGVIGGVLTALGVNFRYPLLGGWLARYLAEEETK